MFLGVDGGGSKTAWCLLDRDGAVRVSFRTRPCSYFAEGIGLVAAVLAEGVGRLRDLAGIGPDLVEFAFFGLPGYGEVSADIAALDAAPRRALGHDRCRSDNDMIGAWAGSLAGADGINVIAGTGSMTYGERQGQGVRVGGWGEIFGDEGSGYWVAVSGMRAYSRMCDGRLPRGPLVDVFRSELGLARELDLVDLVLNRWKGGRAEIAAASRAVAAAADAGDTAAAAILADAARELALLVATTRTRLGYRPGEAATVSWSGGMFGDARLRRGFRDALAAAGADFRPVSPRFPPDRGAALYAAKLAGAPLGPDALHRLEEAG